MRRLALALCSFAAFTANAERINQEGRILGPALVVTQPILFNTPEADAVVSAMQIMPVTNPWNENITNRPYLGNAKANSDAMITQIRADLDADKKKLRAFYEMNYVLVPDNQPTVQINFFNYPDESDLDGGTFPNGLYPIPSNLPIENWPKDRPAGETLSQWQQSSVSADRHSIMVKPGAGFIWETWLTRLVSGAWRASNGAKFNLNSNTLRPDTWTSGDAAGLPMFPATVRYDECQRGMVEHAIRLVVKTTRQAHIYPATHQAGSVTDSVHPAMGQRLRLRSSFVIPSGWTIYEKAVLKALKKYGAIVADNGSFFSISVTPDQRFPDDAFSNLQNATTGVDVSDFEVIETTTATGGPRSPNPPSVNAGPDQFLQQGTVAQLGGSASTPGGPATIQWTKYSGPGTVTFGNAAQSTTTATFSMPGIYTLMLSADDGLHAVAYDAVVISSFFSPELLRSGNDTIVRFPTLTGHTYRIERNSAILATGWTTLSDVTGTGNLVQVPHTNALNLGQQFYRVTVLN